MRAVPALVANVFDEALAARPAAEALVTRTRRLTYAQLDREADQAAAVLRGMGIRPGDRVAASLPNEADVVIAFHGAMRIGAVWVGVNRALAPPEKAYILDDSGASLILCDDTTASALASYPTRRVLEGEWRSAVDAAEPTATRVSVDPAAPAAIAYTSGTTGHPKGAVHSQRNLLLPGAVVTDSRGYGPDLRKGDCLPLTILNMIVLTTLLVAQAEGCSIVMDRIDAEGVAEWVRQERVTVWNGPPALLHSLVMNEAVRREDLSTLEEVWTGGADCPEAVRSMFERKFGHNVVATYGLTEAPTIVSIDPRDGPHVAGASGRPLAHLDVRVLDTEGNECATGEIGEVCIRPQTDGEWAGVYRTMLCYWQKPAATDDTLRGGTLHTGDIGSVDGDGNLFIRDRKSLVIVRGGANVYPAEVERVLHEAPGVVACAVLGLPHERLGESVAAAVQAEDGAVLSAAVLEEHCLAHLARYKVPERFLFVDAFPRNSMGKISRKELPALFE